MCKSYSLINPLSYHNYSALVSDCAANKKCTGEQLPDRIEATKINAQRISRIYKTYIPSYKITELVRSISSQMDWIIIAESWCGDAAQNVPIIAKLAELNSKINLKIILRDENLLIMDWHLTNGSRSIPKLIFIDQNTGKLIMEWGPRPSGIQKLVKEFKTEHPTASHDEFVKNLHLWYAKDRGLSLEEDLIFLLSKK